MNNRVCDLKAKKGFTLVELIVVIAIIAILTAVIIPVIARYSAQGRYTTLQDAAQTISNSANNALADGNQLSPINITLIEGTRTGGELEVTLWYNSTKKAIATKSTNGLADSNNTEVFDGSEGEKRAAERLCDSLATTIPDNCAFLIAVSNSAVSGVIYTNTSSDIPDIPDGSSVVIGAVEGFSDAYAYDGGHGEAVGVSGKFRPE